MDRTKTGPSGACNATRSLTTVLLLKGEWLIMNDNSFEPHVNQLPPKSPYTQTSAVRKAFSRKLKLNVWSMTNGRCFYCGLHTNPFITFTIDHIFPVCRGGGNDIRNLVPCCARCNSSKGSKLLDEWKPRRPFWFLSDDYQENHATAHAVTCDEWIWDLIDDREEI